MVVRIQQSARSVQQLVEFEGTVFRRCDNCHEPNPSHVQCPRCDTWNQANAACRSCGGPGRQGTAWGVCPRCGTKAKIEKQRIYFHKDRWRVWRNDLRLWFTQLIKGKYQ